MAIIASRYPLPQIIIGSNQELSQASSVATLLYDEAFPGDDSIYFKPATIQFLSGLLLQFCYISPESTIADFFDIFGESTRENFRSIVSAASAMSTDTSKAVMLSPAPVSLECARSAVMSILEANDSLFYAIILPAKRCVNNMCYVVDKVKLHIDNAIFIHGRSLISKKLEAQGVTIRDWLVADPTLTTSQLQRRLTGIGIVATRSQI